MAGATWVQTNFNAGEWSPLAHGRFDIAKYKNGLAKCLNFMPTQQGGLTKRPGTRFVAAVKDSSYAPRLVRFEFSANQAYILEFGNLYVRFYTNDGQLMESASAAPWVVNTKYDVGAVVSYGGDSYRCNTKHVSSTAPLLPGPDQTRWDEMPLAAVTPYEVVTPFSSTDVWELNFSQSADTLYIAHPNHTPFKLQRAGAANWIGSDVSVLDGPYVSTNVTTTTLTPSATSGTATVTASSITGINNDVGFRTSDVGRMLRLKCGGVWLWGTIATRPDSTHVTWAIQPATAGQLPATAQATANISGGSVFSVTVTNGGSGYGVSPPSVSIIPVVTDPATATVTVTAGVITAITITHAGSGYVDGDFPITFGAVGSGTGAYAVANVSGGAVVSTHIWAGGTSYDPGTTADFSAGIGTAGSGAVAYANLTEGVVTSITISVTGTGYTSGAVVVIAAPTALVPASTTFWRLGEWNSTDGYPNCVVFHQDRLCFSGNAQYPGKVNASNVGDYENFAPSNIDGTITDSNAFAFTLNAGTVNLIRWMVSDENGLLIGTAGGEWIVAPSSAQQAITPTNVNAKPLGNYGSANVTPLRVGKATLFVQRTGRKIREMFYQFTVNTFQSPDISLVSEHLTKSGIKQMAMQLAPQQMVWMDRNDGTLVGMTYDKEQEVCGWHGHFFGGYSDAGQTIPALIESVAGIPTISAQRDEVWVVAKRYINGAVSRTVEVFAKPWEDGDAVADAVFLDCSATYSGAPTATISGLTWLKGQTVGVLTDGLVHADKVVSSSGGITLDRMSSKVQVGFNYYAEAQTLRIEAGGSDGPSQGKLKRVFRTIFRFFQTMGLDLWSSAPGIGFYPAPFRDSSDPMDQQVPLFDGDKRWAYDGTSETDGQVRFRHSQPLPCNITLLVAQLETQDGR